MEPLTNLGMSVATEATTSLLSKIKKHIGYLFKYKENLNGLEIAKEKLDAKRTDAGRFEQDTKSKQRDVSSTDSLWLSEAEKLHLRAQNIIPENNLSWLHPLSRYSTSKHALELVQEINGHVGTAPKYGDAFDRKPPQLGDTFELEDFMEFGSRESVVDGLWEALKDEKVRMCSLCGMGGTGKTKLVKKLIQRVEMESFPLFDKIAMATISKNPTDKKIRTDIMSSLRSTFRSEDLDTSDKLRQCLMNNGESVLLILDDVWEELDFERIGIPKAKLKILFTSREQGVCERMGCETNIVLGVLEREEPWDLFKNIAIGSIEKLNLHDRAREIANQCGGLPIVLVTLAGTLKHAVKKTWNDTLIKLKKSNLQGIEGMKKVYSQIQLSYDLLKDDPEAQTCFRLCCLFPEDDNIPIEYLVLYGKGLELFKDVESMNEIRDRVGSIISKLQKSFWLFKGDEDETIRMHDVLRDFALSISSESYIVGFENVKKWPDSYQCEECSAISLMCDEIKEYPVDLRCPKLELLQLFEVDNQAVLPIGIFDGLKELKVLFLQVPSLFSSFKMLRKLRSLVIYVDGAESSGENEAPKLGDLLGDGDLKDLQILLFSIKYVYDEFPQEIGLLYNLRCLHFHGVEFKYMAPGVLSKLTQLEELLLPHRFDRWGCKEEEEGERMNASIDEIESLPLTTLKTSMRNTILSEKLVKNLTKLELHFWSRSSRVSYENGELKVYYVYVCDETRKWINALLRNCERFKLLKVGSLETVMFLQSAEDNWLPKWKDIDMSSCDEIEYLVDTVAERIPSSVFSHLESLNLKFAYNLKDICPFSKIEPSCFSNLGSIRLRKCLKLKHLFPLSVARELRHLQVMDVSHCEEMVVIFYKDEIDDDRNEVASSIELITPTPTALKPNTNTDEKPRLICPTPNSFFRCLRGKEKQPKIPIMEESSAKVEEKQVGDAIILPQLKTLKLRFMDKLRSLCEGNHTIELPSLEKLIIYDCNMMEALSISSLSCPMLKEITINKTDYPTVAAAQEDLNAILKKKFNRPRLDSGNEIEENDNDKEDEIHSVTN